MVIVFAAGNFGYLPISDYTTSAQSTSKNAIIVGASDANTVAFFSSRGPTYDGRIKPDVVAPGWAIESASSGTGKSCSVISKSGNYKHLVN